jgi:hypothetical protein
LQGSSGSATCVGVASPAECPAQAGKTLYALDVEIVEGDDPLLTPTPGSDDDRHAGRRRPGVAS